MPIQNGWYIEGLITYHEYEGEATTEDIQGSIDFLHEASEMTHNPLLHMLVDCTQMQKTQHDLAQLTSITRQIKGLPLGWMVVIMPQNTMVRKIAQLTTTIVSQAIGIRVRMFESPDAGLQFLADIDETVAQAAGIASLA